MTIGLSQPVVINTTFAYLADATAIYATLNQLVVDVVRSRSTERIIDRYGAGCTIGSTRNRYPQMVGFSHSRQLIEIEKLRGFVRLEVSILKKKYMGEPMHLLPDTISER